MFIRKPFIISYIIHLITYWGYSLIWYYLNDINYDKQKAINVAKYVLKIQLSVIPLIGVFYTYFYNSIMDIEYVTQPLSFSAYDVFKFGMMSVWEDILFFHIHRKFHSVELYKYHKLHHSWKQPVPWGTLYASITENILANFLPILTAPMIMHVNIVYLQLWIFVTTFSSVYAHNGKGKHNRHHQTFKNNYGTLGLCDKIYGTND
jgi:sterol desaturase/sphingolipid hydroxylase (fatty acid hydroxylase superfamily)